MCMVVHDDTQVVPTRAHAEAAAGLLAAEGAAMVLLHGSVDRDAAHSGSDVDLVAVFDDIDYSERWPLRWRLEAVCEEAVGVPFDIHVTDRPEWRHRTEQVMSSYEAAVMSRHHVLCERASPADAVDWDKPIGMATDNTEEALNRLENVTQALEKVLRVSSPGVRETRTGRANATPVTERARERRLRSLCAEASIVIETSLKAWCAAVGATSERTHKIVLLLAHAKKVEDVPAVVMDALAPLEANTLHPKRGPYDDVSCWRNDGTYPNDAPTVERDNLERLARLISAAAPITADAVLRRLLKDGINSTDTRFADCATEMRSLREALRTVDPITGELLGEAESDDLMVPPMPDVDKQTEQRLGLLKRLLRRLISERGSAPQQRRVCGRKTRAGGRCQRRVGPSGNCPEH